jgi:hypothetical protein
MNKWKIWFGEHAFYTLNSMTIVDLLKLIPPQNWKFVTKIEIV